MLVLSVLLVVVLAVVGVGVIERIGGRSGGIIAGVGFGRVGVSSIGVDSIGVGSCWC